MTLSISYFNPDVSDPDDGFIGMAELPGDLFGFETWRGIWGSEEMLKKGGVFLSKLKNEDLFIYPDELDTFKEELLLIFSEAENLAQILNVSADGIKFRLNNAIDACKVAKVKGYGVCIS